MDNWVVAWLLTLIAGMSTALGAVLAFFTDRHATKLLSWGLGFSAGVMIIVSFGELLVQSRHTLDTLYGDMVGDSLVLSVFLGGFLFSYLIDRSVPDDVNPHELKSAEMLAPLDGQTRAKSLTRTGLFTAMAIAIHNFPEGFATFVAGLQGWQFGLPIAVAIAIHNIPEGMAISLPLYHATGERQKAFWYATLSGMAEPLGAIIGYVILFPFLSPLVMGVLFGLIAGIMIYISFDELLPAARIYGDSHTAMLGLCGGMGVMGISLILLKAGV